MRILLFLVVLAVCGLVIYAGVLPWREEKLLVQVEAGEILPASRNLLPFAEAPGRALARRWVAGGPGSGEEADFQIRDSIRNRPLYAPSWLDLAEVAIKRGDEEKAKNYVETAVSIWPNRRLLLWEAAMLWLRLGEREKALATLRAYLRSRPDHLGRVAVIAARLEPDPEKLIEAVVPAQPPLNGEGSYYAEQLLYYAIKQTNLPLAEAAWARIPDTVLMEKDRKTGYNRLAESYINFLVKQKQRDRAIAAWKRAGGSNAMETIENGGFEKELAQGGFGWVARKVDGASWTRDDEIVHDGSYSLRVDFDGEENVNYHHLWQRVPVEPGGRYRVQGYWRGAYVTTRSNPFIQIYSIGAEKNTSGRSEAKRLTWEWRPFEAEITVPGDAWFVTVRLRRARTDALDNQISGSVWLDDVRLTKIPVAGQ